VRRWRLVRAGNDAVPASVRRFMQRARRRRMQAALPWAVTATVLVLAGLAAWAVYGTGLLGVRHVRVDGADLVTPEQVRQAAAVPVGVPLARVDLAAVGARVATLPPVERAEVSRRWPDTLVVEVVERTGVAAVPRAGGFAVLDRSGVAFRTAAARPAGLPLVRLARPAPDDPATRAGLLVLASLTPELRERLTELVVDGPARIRLVLGGRTVIWGDSSQGEVKARVATSLLARQGTTIDVSAPDVVTVR
jgi:cell division protein FtsQ